MNLTTKLSEATLKAADEKEGIVEGYASTFGNVDSYNDSIKPGAFAYTLAKHQATSTAIPILFEHDRTLGSHIGEIVEAKEDTTGLYIKAKLDMDTEAGARAFSLAKGRRIKGMSIGFYPQKVSSGVVQGKNVNIIEKVDLKEVSLVLNPADAYAVVTSVKAAARSNGFEEALASFNPTPERKGRRLPILDQRRNSAIKAAREILDGCNGYLSDDDYIFVKSKIEEIQEFNERIEAGKAAAATLEAFNSLDFSEDDERARPQNFQKSRKDTTMNNRLATKAGERLNVAGSIASSLMVKEGQTSTKGVAVTGEVLAPVPVGNGILPVERETLALLAAIPTVIADAPAFSYLRQTVRELNADVVATGAEKPKSNLGFERVDDTLEVVAHIVREVDEYLLKDVAALKSFISTEMIAGVFEKVEQLVVAAIDSASGAQLQAFTTDAFTTARLAKSKLQTKGLAPAFYVLNHDDWALLETTKAEGSGTFLFNSAPVDTTNGTLWGIPVITTSYTPIGSAKLIATESVSLFTDGQVQVAVNTSQADFEHNQVSFRAEGRFKPVVVRSAGLVEIELAAPVAP